MTEPDGSVLDAVRVSLADGTAASHEPVVDAEAYDEATHSSGALDVQTVVHDADAVDYHNAQAAEYQQLQAKEAAQGNWEVAKEYAQRAEGELSLAADHGAPDVPVAAAQQDVAQLDNASWEQRQANEAARAVASYSEAGDTAAAQVYASAADHHQVLADASGHDGIAGAREVQAESGGLHDDTAQAPEHAPDEAAVAAAAPVEHVDPGTDASHDASA